MSPTYKFDYSANSHEKHSLPLKKLQTHDKAANNSRSSDTGQQKFANVQQNPTCSDIMSGQFFHCKSFYGKEE